MSICANGIAPLNDLKESKKCNVPSLGTIILEKLHPVLQSFQYEES